MTLTGRQAWGRKEEHVGPRFKEVVLWGEKQRAHVILKAFIKTRDQEKLAKSLIFLKKSMRRDVN
jgi:hypothetical protein